MKLTIYATTTAVKVIDLLPNDDFGGVFMIPGENEMSEFFNFFLAEGDKKGGFALIKSSPVGNVIDHLADDEECDEYSWSVSHD